MQMRIPIPVAVFVCAANLYAQVGTVKADGQPIPGASIRATQGDRRLLTLTDENGGFQLPGATPGTWVMEADMFGFAHLRREVQIGATPDRKSVV